MSDRIREGTGQWATRKMVADMCNALPAHCTRPSADMFNGIGHEAFINMVTSVPFVACAHGGGEGVNCGSIAAAVYLVYARMQLSLFQ